MNHSALLRPLRLARLFDALYPVVSLFIGLVVAGAYDYHKSTALIIIIVIFNSVAMIWNDIEDKKIDADNGRPELAKSSKREIQQLIEYIVGLVVVGFGLAVYVGIQAVVLCVATLIVTWLYNSRPVVASRRPVASLIVLSGAGAFLPYMLGASMGSLTLEVVLAGVLWWIGRISLSVLKDYKDAKGDTKHGKRTFLLRFGARWVARISVACLLVGYGGFVFMFYETTTNQRGFAVLMIAVIIFAYLRRGLFDKKASYVQLDGIFRMVAKYQLLLDMGVVLWLA